MKTRRNKGDGSIVRRPDGTYAHVFDVGLDPVTKKRRRRWISAKTLPELRRKVADAKARGGGNVKDKVKGSVGEWIDEWLEGRKTRAEFSKNSWILYESTWRLHAKPSLENVKLETFDKSHVRALERHLVSEGVSASVRNRVRRVLHVAIEDAITDDRYIATTNPISAMQHADVVIAERPALEPTQAVALIHAARGDRFEALWILLLTGGLRLGEALGLEWSNVDFDDGAISIKRSMHEIHGRVEFGPTKTKKSRRRVVLGALAIQALRERQKAAMAEHHKSTLVFCTAIGTPMRRGNLLRSHFRPICKAADLSGFRIHDLRHASASFALLSGAPAKAVADRLGHSTVRLTLDRYTHVLNALERTTADGIDGVITATKPRLK